MFSAIANVVSGLISKNAQKNANENNAQLQRDFAQQGIRWRVEDAQAAGVHPLVALGAQTHQASPSYVGDTSFSNSIANAGQSIQRSVDASRTAAERQESRLAALAVERGELENDLLRSQIAQLNSAPNPPLPSAVDAGPMSGQGNFVVTPAEATASSYGVPEREAGAINTTAFARTSTGGLSIVPSRDMKERMEDDFISELGWHLRNTMLPYVNPWRMSKSNMRPDPKQYPPPKGYKGWRWEPTQQEYVPY